MGAQHALGRGAHDIPELESALLALTDTVCRRLRRAGRTASTVTLRLRFGDFRRSTSSRTLARPTESTDLVAGVARDLLRSRRSDIEAFGISLVGVALSGLDGHGEQLMLPLDDSPDERLDSALDAVRERFGAASLTRATQLRDHRQR